MRRCPLLRRAGLLCAALLGIAGVGVSAVEDSPALPLGGDWVPYASDAAAGSYALAWAHALWSDALERVVVMFGNSHNPAGNNSVRAFDPATNTWEVLLPSTNGSNPHVQCTNRDVHYSLLVPNLGARGEYWVIGGSVSSAWPPGQNTCRFDLDTRTWTHIGNVPSSMGGIVRGFASYENAGPGASGWDPARNTGVLFGGARAATGVPGSLLQVIEPNPDYPADPAPYRFWKRDDIGTIPGRSQLSSSGVMGGDGYFYVWGGRAASGANLDDFWRLNLDTMTWEALPTGPPPAYQPVVTYDRLRRALVVHGGSCTRGTWVYDIAASRWADVTDSMQFPSAEYPRRNRLRAGVYAPSVDRHIYTGGVACDESGQPIAYPEGARTAGYRAPGAGGPPPPPAIVAAVLPSGRSVQVKSPATAFASVANSGGSTATDCAVSLATNLPAAFSFQTTDPATNEATGQPNTPVNIGRGGLQTFVLALTPSADFEPTDVRFTFACGNTSPAPLQPGLNTLLLSASTGPVPDIVALAATAGNTGIASIPGATGTGAFAVATVNVGTAGTITASLDTGGAALPLQLSLCQTFPATGQCASPIGPSVTIHIPPGTTPTFGVFVQGAGSIPFDPASNRVFVRFTDQGGVTRGSTSVAVRTQ